MVPIPGSSFESARSVYQVKWHRTFIMAMIGGKAVFSIFSSSTRTWKYPDMIQFRENGGIAKTSG